MSPFWSYFWPIIVFGLLMGGLPGLVWLRRKRRILPLAIAGAVALAGALVWSGPLGAAGRFTVQVEARSRAALVDWEMGQVQAHLHRAPLSRRLVLSGPADDFQRSELVRIMSLVPGVSSAEWSNSTGIPLVAEALIASAAAFVLGVLLAYGVELRRRYNSQWSW